MLAFPRAQSYSHWPATDAVDFVGWTAAEAGDFARRATHTSFLCCGYHYGGKRPPRPSSWVSLTGAVTGGLEEARALAGSWLSPARVETSGLFEGYAFSERAYRLRLREPGPITVRLSPTRPIVNPVFRVYYGQLPVKVMWDGRRMEAGECRAQPLGDELLLWMDRRMERETTIEIIPE